MGVKIKTDKNILIIIPAFNEELNISNVIFSLKKRIPFADLLVINDGSKDRTGEIVSSIKDVSLINLPANLGIGGAVQTGFMFAKRYNYNIAVQFDGDGQHLASEIPKIILPIEKKSADVVIGSRFRTTDYTGFRSTFLRRIGIRFFEIINSMIIRQRISDNTSGFRAYNKNAIHFLADNYPMDYPEPEAVIMLGKNRFRIKEVYSKMQKRNCGTSSINGFDSVFYMIKVLLAVLMNAVRPRITQD
ncbi:MAG: glycosyltransferase family 2 protein [Thermodesulfobacteriota bacterium]|nr:glycosyltransferase family 2 protein [Thermodesulfobacteriota bacterium]